MPKDFKFFESYGVKTAIASHLKFTFANALQNNMRASRSGMNQTVFWNYKNLAIRFAVPRIRSLFLRMDATFT